MVATEKRIQVNKEQLREWIERTIRRAGNGLIRHGRVARLYGRHDGKKVYEFYTTIEASNSWTVGSDIISLYSYQVFDPLDSWDLSYELEHELESDSDFEKRYYEMLSITGNDKRNVSWNLLRAHMPDDAYRIMSKWESVAIEDCIMRMLPIALERLEEDERIELV